MNKIELTTETVNKIINYLASKPFIEVSELINTIISESKADNQDN